MKHTDCACFMDTRCQLAVAYQQARDYWAANPNDTENGPNEIHQSIEKWLIAKNLLNGPAVTVAESRESAIEVIEPEMSPSSASRRERRSGLKLPRLRVRPMRTRRMSLPAPISETQPANELPRTRLRRRHTAGPSSRSPLSSPLADSVSAEPVSPRSVWRRLTGVLKSPVLRQKRPSPIVDVGIVCEGTPPSMLGILCDSLVEEEAFPSNTERDDIEQEAATSDDADLRAVVDEGPRSNDSVLPVNLDTSTKRANDAIPTSEPTCADSELNQKREPATAVDPAYKALLPMLCQLEAITQNPNRRRIGEEHGDEDYAEFWDAFGQLSAREVLYAVYAIRAGALDAPIENDCVASPCAASLSVTAAMALWAMLATVLAVYLYLRLL